MRMKKIFCAVFILFNFFNFAALAKPVGYRVISRDKTIIQIARDIYKDQNKWPKIAKWNNLVAPYTIRKGQVLVLLDNPVVPVPEANLVQDVKAPVVQVSSKPGLENTSEPNISLYIVSRTAPTLSLIGLELYGNRKMADIIAKWNGLPKNAPLILHQKLKLKIPPTITVLDGRKKLIEVWTAAGNAKMVARLGGGSKLVEKAQKNKEEAESLKAPSASSKIEPEVEAVMYPQATPAAESVAEAVKNQNEPVAQDLPLEKVLQPTEKMDEKAELKKAVIIPRPNVEVVGKVSEPVHQVKKDTEKDLPLEDVLKPENVKVDSKLQIVVAPAPVEPQVVEDAQVVPAEAKAAKVMTAEQDPELAEAAPSVPVSEPAAVLKKPEPIQSEPIAVQPQVGAQPPVAEKKEVPVTAPVAATPPAPVNTEGAPQRAPAAAIPFEEPTTDSYWLGGNAERIIKNLSNKVHSEKVK